MGEGGGVVVSPLIGAAWQREFEARWAALGKAACLFRFEDQADLYGRNGGRAVRPAGAIRPAQMQAAIRWVAAGGEYRFALRSMATGRDYLVPAQLLFSARGKVPWATFEPWAWKDREPCLTTSGGCP
jgi:hypothetical protein